MLVNPEYAEYPTLVAIVGINDISSKIMTPIEFGEELVIANLSGKLSVETEKLKKT
jgi:hypothetical protein